MTQAPWLVVVDLQPAFSHPDSPWYTPDLARATEVIAGLVPLYGERVIFTRFVPPAELGGSWLDYYEKWPFATKPEADWLWAVDAPFEGYRSLASHTFSKWVPEMQALVGPHPEVAICGVSTDCCVMGTVLGAVDDGARVRVIADACAAQTDDLHQRALDLMALRAPQLAIVTAAEERARLASQGQDT